LRGSTSKSPSKNFSEALTFLTEEVNSQNGKVFKLSQIVANKSFTQQSKGKKDNLIKNLFKPFKDMISKTNTSFRQHHDFLKENFSKRFRNSD
jgi:hypothetical protein